MRIWCATPMEELSGYSKRKEPGQRAWEQKSRQEMAAHTEPAVCRWRLWVFNTGNHQEAVKRTAQITATVPGTHAVLGTAHCKGLCIQLVLQFHVQNTKDKHGQIGKGNDVSFTWCLFSKLSLCFHWFFSFLFDIHWFIWWPFTMSFFLLTLN